MHNFFDADPVSVTVGETTPGIHASLALAGHITGTVTGPGGAALIPDVPVSAYAFQAATGTWFAGPASAPTAPTTSADSRRAPTASSSPDNDGLYTTEYWDGAATVENDGDMTPPGTQSGE